MAIEHLRPTTRSGIKSLARSLKTPGLTHQQALDAASMQAGFENWAAANRALKIALSPARGSSYKARLIAYWRDFQDKTAGAEEIEIPLSQPLTDLVRKERALRGNYLGSFKLEGDGYLVDRSMRCWSRSVAYGFVERGAYTLQFMETSGLRPSFSHRNLRHGGRTIPGRDHLTAWFDPRVRKYVLVDEPYGLKGLGSERELWAIEHQRRVLKPLWKGMHNPNGGTEAYLIAETNYDLAALSKRLDGLVGSEAEWSKLSRPIKY